MPQSANAHMYKTSAHKKVCIGQCNVPLGEASAGNRTSLETKGWHSA